ncbi:hypothetical protein MNBD_GAMMA04-2309 [hydrothermal vent metagenome]|uniref:SPOR domain-containing protein n=1 Tax=hydrothermal vent metagenome TaxID=652676 RepID=A0A3B0WEG8_9ZZZZ
MTRDYRHGHGKKQAFQRKSQQESPKHEGMSGSFIWLAAVLISLGLAFVFFIANYFLSQSNKPLEVIKQSEIEIIEESKETPDINVSPPVVVPAQLNVVESVISEEPVVDDNDSSHTNTSHHYSFYHGLSQTEVVVEAELISVALTQPYYIQAGSFGSEKVANQELKRLEKHGQSLTVSALTKGSRTYYRLRMGPFKDRLVMNKKRNELRKLGVDTLLIKASN